MNPWKNFAQAPCLPDDCQCEAARDAFIRQPSSFWSSLVYIFAGFAIYKYVKEKTMDLKTWAGVCILMGFSSLFAHGSFTRFALAIDFASIILVLSFFAFWNGLHMIKVPLGRIFILFMLYYFFLVLAMYSLNKWAKIILCLCVFAFAIVDVLKQMGRKFVQAGTLQLSIFILTISFGFFIIDEMRIDCDPHSLFQWHAVWHFGTAVSMFLYGKWRFDELQALRF